MKGALAAMMSATLALSSLPEPLEGDVIFTGVVDEEHASKGTSKLVERFRPDAAIVGEPTDLDVAIAHKGYAWLEIETLGREAHGSVPERGIDAIEKMSILVSRLEALRRKQGRRKHPLVGTARIHTSTISGGTDWATVPGRCVLRLERRLIPGEGPEDVLRELRQLIEDAAKSDRNLKAQVRLVHYADSMDVSSKQAHVRLLLEEAGSLTGKSRIIGVPYWTDAAILVKAGIPSCLYGPGDIRFAHGKNENIKIADVATAARIYAATAQRYCNTI
jgi:acetylornithine deacetylase/succinyl-diaminopimelate desuccinylase-like protein